jgi:hypothetical protein
VEVVALVFLGDHDADVDELFHCLSLISLPDVNVIIFVLTAV